MAVLVERHRRGLVPEHRLHDLHIGPGSDGESRCGVAQLVGVEAREYRSRWRAVKRGAAEAATAAQPPRSPAKTKIPVGACPLRARRGRRRRKARDRHFALLVTFRRPERHRAHRRHGLGDQRAAAKEVDPAHAQRGHLAEPEAGIGEEQDDEPVLAPRQASASSGNLRRE